ncbi:hypothetical protein AA0112_g9788 [Alternaria arborescens]|uniref:hypothetical protein n=1 Tax=Alternaria arborescens TaxID=156630 RepID=UPI001074ABEC|nr:hypothetical protein AA0111_g7050 [Alternaria arborescens]RYN22555.1 hypothetical protein AA0112_g9788 [Alternaria arborescens]RYO28077.1 hypothetical protein AA0111_g7050 [Alternaria arborescens]
MRIQTLGMFLFFIFQTVVMHMLDTQTSSIRCDVGYGLNCQVICHGDDSMLYPFCQQHFSTPASNAQRGDPHSATEHCGSHYIPFASPVLLLVATKMSIDDVAFLSGIMYCKAGDSG